MKKSVLFLTATILMISLISIQKVNSQEKTREQKEYEEQIQKTIEVQKKAISEQKRAQEEALKQLEEEQAAIEKDLKDIQVDVQINDDFPDQEMELVHRKRLDRSFRFDEPMVISPGVEPFYFHSFSGDRESTSWAFSRSVKEKTIKSEYEFDVEKTSNTVVMSVMGDCKAGEIKIKIVMPGGKTYSDIVIDEFGNLNWRKSFTISETENQDKAGAWKFQISSNKATGYFKISLQTY